MGHVQRTDPSRCWSEVSIVLTDDAGIASIADEFLADSTPTDVLCFEMQALPGERPGVTAEIVVNVARALACGGRSGWTPARELALYLAHGCDHLMRDDDADEAGYRKMRRRELRWLRAADGQGLVEGLLSA